MKVYDQMIGVQGKGTNTKTRVSACYIYVYKCFFKEIGFPGNSDNP